jgi:hypothetical protein
MKKYLLVFGFIFLGVSLFAQYQGRLLPVVFCITKVARSDERNDTLHKIVNTFCVQVGDALKKNYPSKVNEVGLVLSVKNDTLTLSCTALLTTCSPKEAQYYFEHRGSCKVNPDDFTARTGARTTADVQSDNFIEKNPKWQVSLREHTNAVKAGENYWVVYENFLTAPK